MIFGLDRVLAYTLDVPFPGASGKDYTKFVDYFADFMKFAVQVGALLAILIVLYGAIMYVTSAGDEAKAREAKDWIIGSLTGFALLLLIRALISVLKID